MRRLVAAIGLAAILIAAPAIALAQVGITDDVIVPWGSASGAGFEKLLQRVSFGTYYDVVNPAYQTDENDAIVRISVEYKRPSSDGDPRWEYEVGISAACDGCNSKAAKDAAYLQTEGTELCYAKGSFAEEGAMEWPCVEEHRLAGGRISAEVYGFSQFDRNTGNARSMHTTVVGDYTLVVDGSAYKYGNYTIEYMEEFRTVNRELVDLYVSHLSLLPSGGGADPGTGGPAAPIGYVAPVTVIGAIAAVVAAAAAAAAGGTAGGVTTTVIPPTGPVTVGGFVDPDTGQALPVDNGQVWFGDWMPPDEAQKLIDARIDEIRLDTEAAVQHQQFVDIQQGVREEELTNLGFTFDPDTNRWTPGENTHAILDKQWADKIAQDPTWQATQQQFAAIQWELDVTKKHMLQSHNWSLQKEHDIEVEYAKIYDKLWVGAKAVQAVADTSISILATVTGPGGETIKKFYTFTKTLGGELSEKGVSIQTVLTATLKGASDVGMDELGGKLGFDFGKGPDLSDAPVKLVLTNLFGKNSALRLQAMKFFAPGFFSTAQGEAQNWLGWRPMGDDVKKAWGSMTGDKGDAESLLKDPTFLEWLAKRQMSGQQPNVIGGTP